jgi:hypothetical protein
MSDFTGKVFANGTCRDTFVDGELYINVFDLVSQIAAVREAFVLDALTAGLMEGNEVFIAGVDMGMSSLGASLVELGAIREAAENFSIEEIL